MIEAIARAGVSALDTLLRRVYHVQEFTQTEGCLLRIAFGESDREIVLSDGTRIHKGEPVIELHFWNERIPPMDPDGPDPLWTVRVRRRLIRSLWRVGALVATDPQLVRMRRAVGGITMLVPQN